MMSARCGQFRSWAMCAMVGMQLLKKIMCMSGLALGLAGCGISYAPLPAGAIAGRVGTYNYSPSAIQSGDLEQIWWCGSDINLTDRTQFSDSIQYESINLSTKARYGPVPVPGENQYA